MKISPKQYAQVLFEIVSQSEKNDLPRIINNFAKLLIKHNCASSLNKIIYFFDEIWIKQREVTRIQIVSAYELDPKTSELLERYLDELVSGEKESFFGIDKKIKGGFLLRYGDNLVDYSLQNRLRQLKIKLIN